MSGTKDAVATMGAVLPENAGGRDAVHVAVVAVTAYASLKPGQDVGLMPNINAENGERFAAPGPALDKIGIVDPFIKGTVNKGQRFWLYLYPRTITALSHRWSHPAFPDAGAGEVYAAPSAKLASEKWIRDFGEPYGVVYRDMIEAAKHYLETGDYFCRGGEFEGVRVPDEFWEHYERVTATVVPTNDRNSFFTCAC